MSRPSLWLVGLLVVAAGLVLIFTGESPPPRIARGATAPDFSLPVLGSATAGKSSSLRDQRGRVVFLNFWATWCKPCEDEMPAMQRLYRGLQGEPFELLAVSVDDSRADVEVFRERLGLDFPILLDPDERISRLYQTTGYPETLLIDASGTVVERYVGPRDWDSPLYVERIRELVALTRR